MKPIWPLKYVHFISPDLWKNSPLNGRSKECTPIYIERYTGPRRKHRPEILGPPHDFWEITAVYSGHGELCSRNIDIKLKPTSVCLIPPCIPHSEVSLEGMDTIWLGFYGQYATRLKLTAPVESCDEQLIKQIEQLWLFAHIPCGPIGPELDVGTAAIVTRLFRLMNDQHSDNHVDYIDRAIKYMFEHCAEPIAIPKLAAGIGCSTGYFQRTFRKRTGKTPVEFLTDLRLRQACNLLQHSDLNISEIAERTGYQNVFYFSRIFSRHIGVNPNNYRKVKNLVGSR